MPVSGGPPWPFDPVFNPDDCTVPPVEPIDPIPGFDDCTIEEAPPPITDCPDPPLPLPGPTGAVGPCPDLTMLATIQTLPADAEATVEVSLVQCQGAQDPQGAQDGCCFVIQFEFGIPIGPQGPQGPQGPTGPQGPQGPSGDNGTQSEICINVITGAHITQDCDIQFTTEEQCYTVKTAIVPYESTFMGLHCIEAPEVLFLDGMEVDVWPGHNVIELDPRFVRVCEPGSLRLAGLVPRDMYLVSGYVSDAGRVIIESGGATKVTMMVLGVRKGCKGIRFPEYDAETRDANDMFWAQAHRKA